MRTLTSGQEAERIKDGISAVWLLIATFDQYGLSTTTKRYASRDYTLSSNAYDGLIAERGLRFGFARIKPIGGLAPVHSWSLRLRDEAVGSAITDTHVIANDPLIAYMIMPTGSEADSDKIELMRGVVERYDVSRGIWNIRLKDDSKKDLIKFPTSTLNPVTYPFAYDLGAVIPEAFGNLNSAPDDTSSTSIALAPCRFLDKFALTATSSLNRTTAGNAYQYYTSANRFARINNSSESAGILTLSDPVRTMQLRPSRAKVTNDVTTWYNAADGVASTTAAITTGSDLDVYIGGSPKLGTLASATIKISATGSYNYTVKDDTTVKTGPTSASGDVSYALTLSEYTGWTFDLLNIEIDGTGSATIKDIHLEVVFDDFVGYSDDAPLVYQGIQGYKDVASSYKDGAVVDSANSSLRNPVDILEAILRGKNLINLPTAKVDSTSFNTAKTSRSSWYFDFALTEQVSDSFLDRFAFEAGLFFWNQNGKWTVAAMDKSREPDHFFAGNYSSPVIGNLDQPQSWQFDLNVQPVDSSRIFNEIAIRYAPHPATGTPQKAHIESGQFRLSGTAATESTNNTLTDSSATFVTDGVIAGERIYISNDTTYTVSSVSSETQLVIAAVDSGTVTDQTGANYYLGPHISEKSYISQQAYKIVSGLGGNRQQSMLDDAGFRSRFIHDATTAEALATHALEWFSQPRDTISLSLLHDGLNVELGDILMLDHPKLKASQRGEQETAAAEDIDASETDISVTAGTAGLLRVNDYLYLQASASTAPEAVKVTAVDSSTDVITVTRGQYGTTARTHANNAAIYRMTTKWIVTGLRPPMPDDPTIGIECEEVPLWYFPMGTVVEDSYPNYSSASAAQQVAAGWATPRSGRLSELDPDSNISNVG